MSESDIAAVGAWVTRAGLAGLRETELLVGFCDRLVAAGLPLARVTVVIDTLHPVHEGRVFRWRRDQADAIPVHAYGRTTENDETAQSWQRSPFYRLLQTGGSALRQCIAKGEADFPVVEDLRAEGQTDYLALIHRFAEEGKIGEMDCVYSSWTTEAPGGFGDADVAALEALAPSLALAIKCASLAQIAETLVETYLGRDAGRRVLTGRIARGVADRIEAVLWSSDLHGFTRFTDTASAEQVIPLLNDYAEAAISAIYEQGGDVLKLIGDGILAIFRAEAPGEACARALAAETLMRERLAALEARRRAAGAPVAELYLGLHIGEVFYGNIGSIDRLDFTVIGPAVNETSRIATLCRSADRDILVSAAFRDAAAPAERARLVSVGRYALRGVARPQELFTLDRAGAPA